MRKKFELVGSLLARLNHLHKKTKVNKLHHKFHLKYEDEIDGIGEIDRTYV